MTTRIMAVVLSCAASSASAAAQTVDPPTMPTVSFTTLGERISSSTPGLVTEGVSRLDAELIHQRSSERSRTHLWGGVTVDQTWQAQTTSSVAGAFSADSTVTLTRRMQLAVADRASSAPMDLFAALGSGLSADATGTVLTGSELPTGRTTSNTANATLTRTMGIRSTLTFSGTEAYSVSNLDRILSAGAGAQLTHRIRPSFGWHLGYRFLASSVRQDQSQRLQQHDIDAGVDYATPLSFWRHTTAGVTTGSTVLTDPSGRHLRLDASARVDHAFTANWSASAEYARPIEYLAGFAQPLVSDAIRVSIAGKRFHRFDVSIAGGDAWGAIGAVAVARFHSSTASVRLARRVGPAWRFEIECHDASYRFAGVLPGALIPNAFARRGVQFGFVWAPVARS